jgi:hypothetical protein
VPQLCCQNLRQLNAVNYLVTDFKNPLRRVFVFGGGDMEVVAGEGGGARDKGVDRKFLVKLICFSKSELTALCSFDYNLACLK